VTLYRKAATIAIAAIAVALSRLVFIGLAQLLGAAINDERTVGRLLGASAVVLWASEVAVVFATSLGATRPSN
jgi:hypothetical protein